MRTCSKCLKEKNLEDFPRTKCRKDGFRLECRSCTSDYQRSYMAKNREKLSSYKSQWKKENSDLVNYQNSNRRAKQKARTKEDADRIKLLHVIRRLLTEKTGVVYHVDHIVPLKGKNVCGLHVPRNMRLITKDQNLSKNNRYYGPDSW